MSKQNLVREVKKLLNSKPKDEAAIYYALTDLFYRIDDCDFKNLFKPRKDAPGIKDEHKLVHGECYGLGNGVYVYF